jgi:hypothetical protein
VQPGSFQARESLGARSGRATVQCRWRGGGPAGPGGAPGRHASSHAGDEERRLPWRVRRPSQDVPPRARASRVKCTRRKRLALDPLRALRGVTGKGAGQPPRGEDAMTRSRVQRLRARRRNEERQEKRRQLLDQVAERQLVTARRETFSARNLSRLTRSAPPQGPPFAPKVARGEEGEALR